MHVSLQVNVRSLELEGGKMIKANKFGQEQEEEELILTDDEKQMVEKIRVRAVFISITDGDLYMLHTKLTMVVFAVTNFYT